eukprot:8484892-Pyramimonas_sp.AAC.1
MLAGQTQRCSRRPPPSQQFPGAGDAAGPFPQGGARGSRQRGNKGQAPTTIHHRRAGQLRASMQDRGRARSAGLGGVTQGP